MGFGGAAGAFSGQDREKVNTLGGGAEEGEGGRERLGVSVRRGGLWGGGGDRVPVVGGARGVFLVRGGALGDRRLSPR